MIMNGKKGKRAIVDIDLVMKLMGVSPHIRDNTIYLYLSNLYIYTYYIYNNAHNTTFILSVFFITYQFLPDGYISNCDKNAHNSELISNSVRICTTTLPWPSTNGLIVPLKAFLSNRFIALFYGLKTSLNSHQNRVLNTVKSATI